MLDKEVEPDLAALRSPKDRDPFSVFLMDNWPAKVSQQLPGVDSVLIVQNKRAPRSQARSSE